MMSGIASKASGFSVTFRRSVGVASLVWAVAWTASATQAVAQISPGPRTGVGGEAGGSFRLHNPTFADFPLYATEAPKPVQKPATEEAEEPTKAQVARPGSKRGDDAEDRLRALSVRPTTKPKVTRNSRSKDEDDDEPTGNRISSAYDLLGGRDSASMGWRGGKPDGAQGMGTDPNRLRSSLWRRGSKPAGGLVESLDERRLRGAATRRDVRTGGVRAGAPPARPGYGAPVDPAAATLNAAKSLFLDGGPQRLDR